MTPSSGPSGPGGLIEDRPDASDEGSPSLLSSWIAKQQQQSHDSQPQPAHSWVGAFSLRFLCYFWALGLSNMLCLFLPIVFWFLLSSAFVFLLILSGILNAIPFR